MKALRHIRIFPVVLVLCILSFSLRIGDFRDGMKEFGLAYAQQEVDTNVPDLEDSAEASSKMEMDEEAFIDIDKFDDERDKAGNNSSGANDDDWVEPADMDLMYSDVQQDLYKDLAQRRKDIEKREKSLMLKDALLQAAERELEQKTRELRAVRDEIKSMMEKQNKERDERVASLVKIYEGMKAKDAARIFNTLDLDILVEVITQMSERKSAPILAQMNADRARTITIMLAKQKNAPSLLSQ